MITIRIKTLLLALLSAMCAVGTMAQGRCGHEIFVDQSLETDVAKGVFHTVNETLRHAERYADEGTPKITVIN